MTTTTGQGARLVPGDVVRALALVSVVVGTWRSGLVATALFLLVLGGAMVPRLIGAPPGLDIAYSSTILFAAWAAQLDWYVAVGWLDVAVHAARDRPDRRGQPARAPGLGRRRTRTPARGDRAARHRARCCAGRAVGGGGVGRATRGSTARIQVGYVDTMGDLAAGLAGSVVAAAVLVRRP